VVFLVFNRREELRTSLQEMLTASDYEPDRVDVIVVDNASTDGSADMVRAEFPGVQLIIRSENVGVSGWNEGLAAARGDYVLALDDDCYLPPDGLRRAVAAAESNDADMVSFKVVSTRDPEHEFTQIYLTGLFMFWGCAVLMRRRVAEALGGYDPEIFVWANELDFTLRFFDHGFRHLHLPEVVAQHMKPPPEPGGAWIDERSYRINQRHWAYIAAKLFPPRAASEVLLVLVTRALRDGVRMEPVALRALPDIVRGFIHGLRHRIPLENSGLATFYRANFETFASPWWFARPIGDLVRSLPRELVTEGLLLGRKYRTGGRRDSYLVERAALYPQQAALLEFTPAPKLSTLDGGPAAG
jgi:GT2 family glycosyltransferase